METTIKRDGPNLHGLLEGTNKIEMIQLLF